MASRVDPLPVTRLALIRVRYQQGTRLCAHVVARDRRV